MYEILKAEDLGLKDTEIYKYKIVKIKGFCNYKVERYNSNSGLLCFVTISENLIYEMLSNKNLKEEMSLRLITEFNKCEQRMLK